LDYLKGKGFNLQTCAIALNSIISCSNLTMWEPFDIRCALFKACWYVIINGKVVHGLHYASIKVVQNDIHKCITWPKKSSKGRSTWDQTCIYWLLRPRKLSIFMKTRYVNFSCQLFITLLWLPHEIYRFFENLLGVVNMLGVWLCCWLHVEEFQEFSSIVDS
jgi:hypothetical protein